MTIEIDREQAEVLSEILASRLKELRIASARSESRDLREHLHQREEVVQALLGKLWDVASTTP